MIERVETMPASARRPTISAVVITCDEAHLVEPCLQSVAGWVDDIVVVDMHSTDGTREIVQRYTNRLYNHERLTYVEPARHFAISQAVGDWILVLDSDERVPPALAQELQRIANSDTVDVVEIPFQQIMFGTITRSPGASDGTHPRFFRRGAVYWPPEVHGRPDLGDLRTYTIPAQGPDLSVWHDTWRSVPQVVDKLMRYAPRDVANLQAAGVHFSAKAMVQAVVSEFLTRLFVGKAYEDGMAGLLSTAYFTFYRITIWAELWEAEGRPRQYDRWIAKYMSKFRPPTVIWYKFNHKE